VMASPINAAGRVEEVFVVFKWASLGWL